MTSIEEEKKNIEIALNIYDWIEKRNFKEFESALAPIVVNNKKLWEKIQENPYMGEQKFIEIVNKLKEEPKNSKISELD